MFSIIASSRVTQGSSFPGFVLGYKVFEKKKKKESCTRE